MRISYVTDIEGNLSLWQRFLSLSKIMQQSSSTGQIELPNQCCFVFGGDCFDKGPGDLRLGHDLVQLKKCFSDRVFLIMGNRDSNKMRFTSELHDTDVIARPIQQIPLPFWVMEKDRIGPLDYLMKAKNISSKEEAIAMNNSNPVTNRLQYILDLTMNSPGAFEFRRQELSEMSPNHERISDDQVCQSFYDSVALHSGIVRQYLLHSDIGVVLGDTLFVHGAVSELSAGFLPSNDNQFSPQPDGSLGVNTRGSNLGAREWIAQLNAWKDQQLAEWIDNPRWDQDRNTRGGTALMSYFYYACSGLKTVTVSTFVKENALVYPNDEVVEYFHAAGIHRVIVGHKPLGDSPIVLRKRDDFEVVMADTSFSDPQAPDCRGTAISEVIINTDKEDKSPSHLEMHGVLRDGSAYDFTMPAIGECSIVGKQVEDGWWVNLDLGPEVGYRLFRGDGRVIEYKIVKTI